MDPQEEGFLSTLNLQDVANTAGAVAKLGILNEALMAGLAEQTRHQVVLSAFNLQDDANTARAVAKLGIQNEDLMAGLAERTRQQVFLSAFNPQDDANTAVHVVVAERDRLHRGVQGGAGVPADRHLPGE